MSGIYRTTFFFFNPNIEPDDEYNRRLSELKRYATEDGMTLVVDRGGREQWLEAVRGLEDEPEGGKRCEQCFRFRLARTVQFAKANNADLCTTVMSISPHKNSDVINRIGLDLVNGSGVTWLEADFKKGGGFQKSLTLSKQENLYRQNYCGCLASLRRRSGRLDKQ